MEGGDLSRRNRGAKAERLEPSIRETGAAGGWSVKGGYWQVGDWRETRVKS